MSHDLNHSAGGAEVPSDQSCTMTQTTPNPITNHPYASITPHHPAIHTNNPLNNSNGNQFTPSTIYPSTETHPVHAPVHGQRHTNHDHVTDFTGGDDFLDDNRYHHGSKEATVNTRPARNSFGTTLPKNLSTNGHGFSSRSSLRAFPSVSLPHHLPPYHPMRRMNIDQISHWMSLMTGGYTQPCSNWSMIKLMFPDAFVDALMTTYISVITLLQLRSSVVISTSKECPNYAASDSTPGKNAQNNSRSSRKVVILASTDVRRLVYAVSWLVEFYYYHRITHREVAALTANVLGRRDGFFTVRVVLPRSSISRFIGRKGETIRAVQQQSGLLMSVSTLDRAISERVLNMGFSSQDYPTGAEYHEATTRLDALLNVLYVIVHVLQTDRNYCLNYVPVPENVGRPRLEGHEVKPDGPTHPANDRFHNRGELVALIKAADAPNNHAVHFDDLVTASLTSPTTEDPSAVEFDSHSSTTLVSDVGEILLQIEAQVDVHLMPAPTEIIDTEIPGPVPNMMQQPMVFSTMPQAPMQAPRQDFMGPAAMFHGSILHDYARYPGHQPPSRAPSMHEFSNLHLDGVGKPSTMAYLHSQSSGLPLIFQPNYPADLTGSGGPLNFSMDDNIGISAPCTATSPMQTTACDYGTGRPLFVPTTSAYVPPSMPPWACHNATVSVVEGSLPSSKSSTHKMASRSISMERGSELATESPLMTNARTSEAQQSARTVVEDPLATHSSSFSSLDGCKMIPRNPVTQISHAFNMPPGLMGLSVTGPVGMLSSSPTDRRMVTLRLDLRSGELRGRIDIDPSVDVSVAGDHLVYCPLHELSDQLSSLLHQDEDYLKHQFLSEQAPLLSARQDQTSSTSSPVGSSGVATSCADMRGEASATTERCVSDDSF